MKTKALCLKVCTPNGQHLFTVHLTETANSNTNTNNAKTNSNNRSHNGSDDPMTDAQRRYLFRILAEQGLHTEQAHDNLKDRFGVEHLDEVSKAEASKMIEGLLEEAEVKGR